MVIRPELEEPANTTTLLQKPYLPVWSVIAARQQQFAPAYRLIRQDDHAHLAGELADRLSAEWLPKLGPREVDAIREHDSGWKLLPGERDFSPQLCEEGRPASFLDISLDQILVAWCASIDCSEALSPLGGLMTGGHFIRLGMARRNSGIDSGEDATALQEFLDREDQRRQRLLPHAKLSGEGVLAFVDLLQFCDVLSLYLCCGATESVEFPQEFHERRVRLEVRDGDYRLSPSPFAGDFPSSFQVQAIDYPGLTISQLIMRVA